MKEIQINSDVRNKIIDILEWHISIPEHINTRFADRLYEDVCELVNKLWKEVSDIDVEFDLEDDKLIGRIIDFDIDDPKDDEIFVVVGK